MFDYRPVPKPTHERRTPKRAQRGEFSSKTRTDIHIRDDGKCVRCGALANHIHHIQYRSQLGDNSKRNGASVCFKCHDYAHSSREGREWFEIWRDTHLDNQGNLIILPFADLFEEE